ncbi:alpha/beta hydrolase [Caulobacter sp. CCUG 60055]|nr:alpha/beta hydrolase [Caulobacter sp. CCUG 60055]MCI3181123.1 alpha/beta hydrolase [Caulobacter sp. CCUG 60055]
MIEQDVFKPAAARATIPVSTAVAADGARLFVREWGRGRPIVFVASAMLPSDMWTSQMLALSGQGFRCIAFDRRGHGRSSDTGGGYDYDTLADDLAAVMAAREARDAVLVSHSFGGGEVARYLSRHGDAAVRGVVLVAPTTPFLLRTADNPHGVPAEAFEALRQAMADDFPKWMDDNEEAFVTPETSAGRRRWIKDLMQRTSLQAVIEMNRVMTRTDFRPELRAIRRPVLVVHGTRDASAPIDLTGRPTAALIPGARLEVYDEAPHGLFMTHAARLNEDLRRFAEG